MNIKVTDRIDQKSYDTIVELLVEYNLSKTEEFRSEIDKPIEIIARNEQNEIIGGLYGRSIWGTLEIKTFAVKPENRSEGVGRKLLIEAEKEAKHQAELAAARAAGARSSRSTRSYASTGSSSGGSSSSYGGTQPTAKKKGWSAAAKGTAIGAGAGALGGVLLDKKDGRGAIIGGVVGAGAGYLIGRDQDRKSGRVQPKN